MAITIRPYLQEPIDYLGSAILFIELPNGGQLQLRIEGEDSIEICNLRTISHEMLIKSHSNNQVYVKLLPEIY